MEATKEVTVLNNKQVSDLWSEISSSYGDTDSCQQTAFYTLINSTKISSAKNILQVACGNGKLLPCALNLKSEECNYYAIDIAPNMISNSRAFLSRYIRKIGVKMELDEWLKEQRLHFSVQNGEQPLSFDVKFDRIFCNVVLQITENPLKMLKNLYNYAEEGCLMGVSIPGNEELSNFFPITQKLIDELDLPTPTRSYYYLYKTFQSVANEAGWEVVTSWEQNAVFPFFEFDKKIVEFAKEFLQLEGEKLERMAEKITEIFQEKKMLNFPFKLFVLRRK